MIRNGCAIKKHAQLEKFCGPPPLSNLKGNCAVLFVRIHTAQPEPMGGSRAGSLTLEPIGHRGRGHIQKAIPLSILKLSPYSKRVKCSIESTGQH